jgi:transcriptional regulator with XRE-family HTH domain
MNSTIGQRLLELRKEKGLNQEDVANNALVNISRNTLSGYENDEVMPPADKIIGLAKIYNVSIDYLCGISNNKEISNLEIGKDTGLSDNAIIKLRTIKNQEGINSSKLFIINSIIEDNKIVYNASDYFEGKIREISKWPLSRIGIHEFKKPINNIENNIEMINKIKSYNFSTSFEMFIVNTAINKIKKDNK